MATVQEIINKLQEYNPDAEFRLIVNNYPIDFSFTYGSSEGCTKTNADTVSFYVDSMNVSETLE